MFGEGPGKIGIIVESAQKAHINGHTGIGFENPGQIHRIQMYLLRNILQKKTFR